MFCQQGLAVSVVREIVVLRCQLSMRRSEDYYSRNLFLYRKTYEHNAFSFPAKVSIEKKVSNHFRNSSIPFLSEIRQKISSQTAFVKSIAKVCDFFQRS